MTPDFTIPTAAASGFALCHSCGNVAHIDQRQCPRCRATLHLRKRNSLARTWALMIGATLLYLPANLLPVLDVESSVKGSQRSTIISGVIQFWQDGDYPVAIIIFSASVLIPILKVIALVFLCIAAQRGSTHPVGTTRLYRITEFIGRWSMVDVFVVAILVGVVQLGAVMSIRPGEGRWRSRGSSS